MKSPIRLLVGALAVSAVLAPASVQAGRAGEAGGKVAIRARVDDKTTVGILRPGFYCSRGGENAGHRLGGTWSGGMQHIAIGTTPVFLKVLGKYAMALTSVRRVRHAQGEETEALIARTELRLPGGVEVASVVRTSGLREQYRAYVSRQATTGFYPAEEVGGWRRAVAESIRSAALRPEVRRDGKAQLEVAWMRLAEQVESGDWHDADLSLTGNPEANWSSFAETARLHWREGPVFADASVVSLAMGPIASLRLGVQLDRLFEEVLAGEYSFATMSAED
jgi:hypothetical protein